LNIEEITGFLLVISCEFGKTDYIGKDNGSEFAGGFRH
jgi:hypothetical protein